MTDAMTSADLRRWAAKCVAEATNPRCSGDERAGLLKMRTALLQVAETQDWLDGRAEKVELQKQAG